MRIDGRKLADDLLDTLILHVRQLKHRDITPALAVILIGDDPASRSYIRQKQRAADRIGAELALHDLPHDTSDTALSERIATLNTDSRIHGIIIQRPLPDGSSVTGKTLQSVTPGKDVDGFLPDSPYPAPVAAAVERILRYIYTQSDETHDMQEDSPFYTWLRNRQIAVIGRGVTAGKPIANHLRNLQCATSIIHSGSPHPDTILSEADIVISCVGKPGVVRAAAVKQGSILISVGIWRDGEGRLHGDYEQPEIEAKADYFTPTPGGVGPVNVACLMDNLVRAATRYK